MALTTVKIAASNSSTEDKAWADVVCTASNAQNAINTAMGSDNVRLLFANGTYNIDSPILIRSGCVLQGASVNGVIFNCNNSTAVMKTSAAASIHEKVVVDSINFTVGSSAALACDFRGFTNSQFTRLYIHGFDLGVWFGGDLSTYNSCWTNLLSEFTLSTNLTGIKLSGVDGSGNSTANQIMVSHGSIICPNTSGAKAIDAIDAQLVVDTCDIGYGNAAAGIVIGANAGGTKVVNCRFEWDAQSSSVYPISIATNSFYHFFSGNSFTTGCTKPNIYDANINTTTNFGGRYVQINDFQSQSSPLYPNFPDGFVDFNIDVFFRRSPTFPQGVYIEADLNSAFGASKANGTYVFSLNTNTKQLNIVNGGKVVLFSDSYSTQKVSLDGSNGQIYFAGDLLAQTTAPTVATAAAAGTGATVSVAGSNTAGLLTLNTGTAPGTGKVVGITWSASKPSANYAVVLTPANSAAVAAMSKIYVDAAAATASAGSIAVSVALSASTTYKFSYHVISY